MSSGTGAAAAGAGPPSAVFPQILGSAPSFLADMPYSLTYGGVDTRNGSANNFTISVFTFDLSGNGTGLPSVTYDFGGEAVCSGR